MKYQVVSANEWLYPDQPVTSEGIKTIEKTVARNSFACMQILVEAGEGGFNWSFTADDKENMEAPQIYRLLPVFVEKNTGERGFTIPQEETADYVTRKAPFWVYDAMQQVDDHIEAPENVSSVGLYVRWPVGFRKPGLYSGTLHLRQGDDQASIPVRFSVMAATVPETETLRLTNWFSLENMARYHQVDLWSEQHWEMIERYGRRMREGRQTDFLVPSNLAEYERHPDGTYRFDFTQTKRLIDLYLGLGFRFINGGTPIFRQDWADRSFSVNIDGTCYPAISDEAYNLLHAYFNCWYDFLKDNGWIDMTIQHVGDEPHEDCATDFRILSGIVRKCMPGVPLIEAVEIAELDGAVDIWVPKNNTYLLQQKAFERKRKLGDDLWFYTCCCPGGTYLNRMLDGALLRTRYLHWGNFLYNLTGYLHWGLNHYECTTDPYAGRAGEIQSLSTTALPCGDSHIVYPMGKQVLSSVRFEAMRAGCEDYELLRLLQKKDEQQADMLVNSCVQSFTQYTEDADCFEKTYCRLLELLS